MNKVIKILSGGGILTKETNSGDFLEIFLFSLLILIIKGILVMITYNWIAPKLIRNVNQNYQKENLVMEILLLMISTMV